MENRSMRLLIMFGPLGGMLASALRVLDVLKRAVDLPSVGRMLVRTAKLDLTILNGRVFEHCLKRFSLW
eukprot:s4404_g2.t1